MAYADAALILAAHGSTQNRDSSRPTHEHAERIRKLKLFAEVRECFWLEKPSYQEALQQVQSREIYLVPNFLSHGYYTREILPREFSLSGPASDVDGKRIYYCDPVGMHPAMTDVLLHRARVILQLEGLLSREVCLFLAGHGTQRNVHSKAVILGQVSRIRAVGGFGQVEAIFMEEAPFIQQWPELTDSTRVIVVPFFISNGLHSSVDIPMMLGLSSGDRDGIMTRTADLQGRRLWYTPSIGTETGMVDVILAQVEKFRRDYPAVVTR